MTGPTVEVIEFPDVEAGLVGYYTAQLPALGWPARPLPDDPDEPLGGDVYVCTLIPAPRPDVLVRVLRTGGPRLDMIRDAAQVTVDVWHPVEGSAIALADAIRSLTEALPRHPAAPFNAYRVQEFAGPVSQPDPDTVTPRYVLTAQIVTRGASRRVAAVTTGGTP